MIWRNPLAWIGLGALLVPIAVHLLVRMHARPVPFPSLRFLQTSRLAAVRRRALSDWPLLVVRLGIVALAVAALADPFLLNESRRAAWAQRTTRAIIVDTTPSVDAAAASDAAAREQASAFEATTIKTADVRAGIAQGAAWLRTAAPAAREIVIVSDFQRGSLDESTLSALPSYAGVRFVRAGQSTPRRTVDGRPATTSLPNGQFAVRTPHVTVEGDRTQTQWAATAATVTTAATTTETKAGAGAPFAIAVTPTGLSIDALGLRVETSEADRDASRAALDAVLSEGVPAARPGERTIVIAIGEAAQTMLKDGALPPLAAPWMADALNDIARDRLLTEVAATTGTTDGDGEGEGRRSGRAASILLLRGAGGAPLVIAGAARDEASPNAAAAAADRNATREASAKGALALLSLAPASSDVTPLLIRAALRAIADPDPLPEAEVTAIPESRLDAWRRPAALPPIEELTRVETHDRRWLWGGALVLLAIETWLRRRMRRQEPGSQEVAHAA
jgi:hypothetical protein